MAISTEAAREHRPTRAGSPGRAIWMVAGLCWVATITIAIAGADGLGHHDTVLEQSSIPWGWRIGAFTAVWLVMIGAMMLPTTVPMLTLFWTVSARQPWPGLSRAAVTAAYLLVWVGFALVALAGDAGVHAVVESSDWLSARPGLLLGGTLVLAGGFQFSPLKKACLTACRSPVSVLWQHYRRGGWAAWGLGLRHGLLCVGCCWALMLVMFATGVGSLAWMLLLAGLMVAEKTTAWGIRLVAPAGLALIAGGSGVIVIALGQPI